MRRELWRIFVGHKRGGSTGQRGDSVSVYTPSADPSSCRALHRVWTEAEASPGPAYG